MKSGYNMKTLKLDATYRPLEVVDCIEALVLCIIGKATAVEEYEEKISSPSITFKIPSVIVLKTIVKYFTLAIYTNQYIQILGQPGNIYKLDQYIQILVTKIYDFLTSFLLPLT